MLGRLLALALAVSALAGSASAQMMGVSGGPFTVSAPAYTGPCDAVGSCTYFWGLRAADNAVAAAGTQPLIRIARPSDGVNCDVLAATNGNLGNTSNCTNGTYNGLSVVNFLGEGTNSGTIAGTTLTTSGDACTLTAGNQVIGAGITGSSTALQTTIVSKTSCSAGVGVYVLNNSYTISVSETLSYVQGAQLVDYYEQIGNTVTLASIATKATFYPNCTGPTAPACVFFNGASEYQHASVSASQPFTFSVVGGRYANTSANSEIFRSEGASTYIRAEAANTWGQYAGTDQTQTANDNSMHASEGVYNGASSVFSIDGTNTATSPGTGALSSKLDVGATFASEFLSGYIGEVSMYSSALSTANLTALCHNKRLYYGTPGSC